MFLLFIPDLALSSPKYWNGIHAPEHKMVVHFWRPVIYSNIGLYKPASAWMSLIVPSTECQLRWLNGHALRGPLRPCKACEGLRALQPQGF